MVEVEVVVNGQEEFMPQEPRTWPGKHEKHVARFKGSSHRNGALE